jgi:hypothetical protein
VNDKVHTSRRWRAAAELGRYTHVGSDGVSLGELGAGGGQRPGIFTAVPADRASTLPASQRTGNACRATSRVMGQRLWSARDSVPGSRLARRSWPSVDQQVLGCGSFRAFSNPQGITSRCNGRERSSMSRGRAMQVGKPTCALVAHRPAAELGR